MDYDDLLARCESEIESHLLGALYPNLDPDAQKEIEAQHIIDYYDMPVTLPCPSIVPLLSCISKDTVAANAFSAICGTVWAGALLRVQNNSTPTSVTRSIHHNGLF